MNEKPCFDHDGQVLTWLRQARAGDKCRYRGRDYVVTGGSVELFHSFADDPDLCHDAFAIHFCLGLVCDLEGL